MNVAMNLIGANVPKALDLHNCEPEFKLLEGWLKNRHVLVQPSNNRRQILGLQQFAGLSNGQFKTPGRTVAVRRVLSSYFQPTNLVHRVTFYINMVSPSSTLGWLELLPVALCIQLFCHLKYAPS